jgi:hypothetical protein
MTATWTPIARVSLPRDGSLTFIDADRALWLGGEATLVTSSGALVPMPWGPLGVDAAATVVGDVLVVRDDARLLLFDLHTLSPLGQMLEAPGVIFRADALSRGRLVTWSTSHRVTVWDLAAKQALVTYSHRDVRALCGLGGADDPPAITRAERLGRAARLTAQHAVTHAPLQTHHVGLPSRVRACHVVVIPTPSGIVSAITTAQRGEQTTTLHEHRPGAHRVIRRFVEPNPYVPLDVWGLSMETPGLLDCICWGRLFTLSLKTGLITARAPDGDTTASGLRLTFDGDLIHLHHGGPPLRPFGEDAKGEALIERDGLTRALTRAGDTLTWWSLTR